MLSIGYLRLQRGSVGTGLCESFGTYRSVVCRELRNSVVDS